MTVKSVKDVGFDLRAIRRCAFDLFEPQRGGRIGHLFDWFIMGLIAANVVAISIETINALATPFQTFFKTFEIFSVTVFSIEYITRIWSAVENPAYAAPISGRLQFAFRPLVLVDLAAVAPFYLGAVGVGADLRFLRALRLVRIFRLFKLARYTAAVQTFALVFRERKEKLVIAVFANTLVLLVASSLMYHVERAAGSRTFSSIPDAMWWGVATLARLPGPVGYDGGIPETVAGQAAGTFVAILGIGLFALPASILAGGFMEATDRNMQPHDACPHCGEAL